MSERRYYVLREDNCRFESMTKEQIIAAIAEATGTTPTGLDEAFITMLKEQNASKAMKLWVGTSAQYNALSSKESDVLYIIGAQDGVFAVDTTVKIPTKTSELENDAGFIADANIPTKTSDLVNDSGFATESYVNDKARIPLIELSGETISEALASNKEYKCTSAITSLSITFTAGAAGDSECWAIQFTAGDSLTANYPSEVAWASSAPTFTSGHSYYLSFIRLGANYLGAWAVI